MGNFNHLPTDILLDIITRLPAESILVCKLVCRPWRNLVSHNPFFSRMHLTRLHDLDSGKLSFLVRAVNQLHYFEYHEKHDDETSIHCFKRFDLSLPFTSYYKVLGSFNGLACLYVFQNNTACICNPVTKEYVMLPSIKRDCGGQYIHLSSGFGYLPLTDEYKVVEMYKLGKESSFIELAVYTFGSGNGWRNVERLELTFPISSYGPGVYANKALHWPDSRGKRVLVFDLIEEKFRGPLLPTPLTQESTCYHYTVGELGSVLYYAIKYYYLAGSERSDIWLLKKKKDNLDMKGKLEDEQLGWRKEFSLAREERLPLAFTKSGGVLCHGHRHLSVYDPVASTSKTIVDSTALSQIFPHKNTLVALKELGEEDIKLMKRVLQRSS